MKKLAFIIIITALASFSVQAQDKSKIYGGKNYDQFLGCMDCDGEDPGSIWSQYTDYGATHSKKSIWNRYGVYGSFTSNFSPYNPKAKYPPRVVDGNGKCVGYLTVNKNNPKRLTGMVADLICFKRDMVLKDGVEGYAEIFSKIN